MCKYSIYYRQPICIFLAYHHEQGNDHEHTFGKFCQSSEEGAQESSIQAGTWRIGRSLVGGRIKQKICQIKGVYGKARKKIYFVFRYEWLESGLDPLVAT